MATIQNPEIEVVITGSEEITISGLYMAFDIYKDLEEEPNTAALTIYNLGDDMLSQMQDANNQEAPIEIKASRGGGADKIVAYGGNIMDIVTDTMRPEPGHATHIMCEAQKANHRDFMFDFEFAAGTPRNQIVDKMIAAVGLPVRDKADIDTSGILLSETFSGPAFPILRRYLFDMGVQAYISDGYLNLTSIYKPEDFSLFVITTGMLLVEDKPRKNVRIDDAEIAMKTHVESAGGSIFAKQPRKKKKAQTKRGWGSGTTVEYRGVDKQIDGAMARMTLQPDLEVDQIVRFDIDGYKDKHYRVQTVNHFGNSQDFTDWTTVITADDFEDTEGDII